MIDDDTTPEERAEAEALARALERGSGSAALPEDALEAAALLRFSKDGGVLGDDRAKAILDEVLATAKPRPVEVEQKRAAWWRWLVPAGGLAMAAVAALAVVVATREPAVPTAALPAPDAELLRAQARVAAGASDEDARAFERQMHEYRGELLASLTDHYGP